MENMGKLDGIGLKLLRGTARRFLAGLDLDFGLHCEFEFDLRLRLYQLSRSTVLLHLGSFKGPCPCEPGREDSG